MALNLQALIAEVQGVLEIDLGQGEEMIEAMKGLMIDMVNEVEEGEAGPHRRVLIHKITETLLRCLLMMPMNFIRRRSGSAKWKLKDELLLNLRVLMWIQNRAKSHLMISQTSRESLSCRIFHFHNLNKTSQTTSFRFFHR